MFHRSDVSSPVGLRAVPGTSGLGLHPALRRGASRQFPTAGAHAAVRGRGHRWVSGWHQWSPTKPWGLEEARVKLPETSRT